MRPVTSRRTRLLRRVAGGSAALAAILVGFGPLPANAIQALPADGGSEHGAMVHLARTAPAAVPGGKTNFVVSVGAFAAGSTTNWERIGYYTFHPSSMTVTASWWRWNQGSLRDIRVDTKIAAARCGAVTQCYTRTPKRFLSGPNESMTGSYALNGTALTVSWPNGSTTLREKWTVTALKKADGTADTSLVQLTWAGAGGGYGATGGYGFGSNASFAANATNADLMTAANKVAYHYEYSGIAAGKRTGGTSSLGLSVFHQCQDSHCLSATTKGKPGNGCTYYPPGDSAAGATINYYLAQFANDRRDAYEHWYRCLGYNPKTGQTCYKLNSHVKPMLQVIDDAGRFRGWVGAETSYKTTANGNSAGPAIDDTLAIFKAGPRVLTS